MVCYKSYVDILVCSGVMCYLCVGYWVSIGVKAIDGDFKVAVTVAESGTR